jgi:hypothetical protein
MIFWPSQHRSGKRAGIHRPSGVVSAYTGTGRIIQGSAQRHRSIGEGSEALHRRATEASARDEVGNLRRYRQRPGKAPISRSYGLLKRLMAHSVSDCVSSWTRRSVGQEQWSIDPLYGVGRVTLRGRGMSDLYDVVVSDLLIEQWPPEDGCRHHRVSRRHPPAPTATDRHVDKIKPHSKIRCFVARVLQP